MPDPMSTLGTALDVAMVICAFTAIIIVHELGHFIAARWAGIRVLAFAVGFGPAVVSYRKGLGVRRGSSEAEYSRLAQRSLAGGISPTEYRLNALPFGGYVKMLGQDDSDPGAVSSEPDSYQQCKPWKRMVVISAGVVMNVLMAAVLFIVVFNLGLKTEPAKVGTVEPDSPAATAVALNASALGVKEPGLASEDEILSIDGRKPNSFNDLVLASLMAHRGSSLSILVQRKGFARPLEFSIVPEENPETRMQMIGVLPPASDRLETADTPHQREEFAKAAQRDGYTGLQPGMRLVRVNGVAAESAHDLDAAVRASEGARVSAEFAGDDGETATISIQPRPVLQTWTTGDGKQTSLATFEHLLGLVPVLSVRDIVAGRPAETAGLKPGDVFARLGSLEWPGYLDGVTEIRSHKGPLFHDGAIRAVVVRADSGGRSRDVDLGQVPVDRKGMIGFGITSGAESPARVAAWPRRAVADSKHALPSGASLGLLPGSVIRSVESESVKTMGDVRAALRRATRGALQSGAEAATVHLSVQLPVADDASGEKRPVETVGWKIDRSEIETLHALGWQCPIPASDFQPETFLLKAESPGAAISMGLRETHRVMMSTYLTFVRLLQGTVKVEHLKGPVGIAHVGTLVAEKGVVWLLFFMALISVNLAVFNFLPLPIVDGGHFVYLLYEQITGRPVSPAVQNAAAMVGIVLLACLFLVVTYNDIMHLFS